MKTLKAIVLFCLTSPLNIAFAQNIWINSTRSTPDTSSLLDITSTVKGVLIVRVNIIDLTTDAPVSEPETSLLVCNTNVTTWVGFYFWNKTLQVKSVDNIRNADENWYEIGTTEDPNGINDDTFRRGRIWVYLIIQ